MTITRSVFCLAAPIKQSESKHVHCHFSLFHCKIVVASLDIVTAYVLPTSVPLTMTSLSQHGYWLLCACKRVGKSTVWLVRCWSLLFYIRTP